MLFYFTALLNFGNNQIKGTIPSELGYLTSLSEFQFHAFWAGTWAWDVCAVPVQMPHSHASICLEIMFIVTFLIRIYEHESKPNQRHHSSWAWQYEQSWWVSFYGCLSIIVLLLLVLVLVLSLVTCDNASLTFVLTYSYCHIPNDVHIIYRRTRAVAKWTHWHSSFRAWQNE
jgi:hypothetical protein